MGLLSRYIGATVIKLTLLVLVIVLGMEYFILVVGEFGDIGHGNYGLLQALAYAALTLPNNLYSLFPMIGLLGSLLALGSLATSSELVVMRTAGVSVWRIVSAVLMASLLLIVLLGALGEGVGPIAQRYADHMKVIAESGGQMAETAEGVWVKHNNNFIHIQQVLPGQRLIGVSEYSFDDQHQMTASLKAATASNVQGQWVLHQVVESLITPEAVHILHYANLPWEVQLDSKLLGVDRNSTAEMSLWALYDFMRYQRHNGMSSASFALAFWQRSLQPLASLVMIFLAIPFIFGPLRSVTMGVRIVTGAVAGFSFYLINEFFGSFSLVYQIPPLLGASLPILLFVLLAVLLMRRVR